MIVMDGLKKWNQKITENQITCHHLKVMKKEQDYKFKKTPDKLLIRFPILLTQIKAGSNSDKLKNEIRQILFLLNRHNKVTKDVYNNLIKSL